MSALPTGTVTFLFTDIEGSTRLLEAEQEAYRAALARHDALIRQAVVAHGGVVFQQAGDGFSRGVREPDAGACGRRWTARRRSSASRGARPASSACGWRCTPARSSCARAASTSGSRSTAAPA